jgi:diacylglycerol kinase family enzyme
VSLASRGFAPGAPAAAMRVVVLVNARSGASRSEPERIHAALAAAGVTAELRPIRGDVTEAARRAAADGADAVVAAGGDGTISAVAGALAGTDTPLGVLPTGTFNHFARDLGLPLELDAAARALAAGEVRTVDVGEVNGRVFVNNSSIGLYPLAVRERETRRRFWPKPLAMAAAMIRLVARLPQFRLRLRLRGATVPRRTPILFVGNNEYDMKLLAPQRRARLDAGALSVVVVRHASRVGLVGMALRALVGRLDEARDLETLRLEELEVSPRRPHRLLVSADGEVFRAEPPITYRIRPRALRVLAPAAGAGSAEAPP